MFTENISKGNEVGNGTIVLTSNSIEEEVSLLEEVEKLKNKISILEIEKAKLEKEIETMRIMNKDFAHTAKNVDGGIIGLAKIIKDDLQEENFDKNEIIISIDHIIDGAQKNYNSHVELMTQENSEIHNINISEVALSSFLDSFSNSLISEAQKKNINLVNDLDENVSVKADQDMLKSVINNLVVNAIKFTEALPESEKSITISSNKVGDVVKIYISDEGIGLPPERISNFFEDSGYTTLGTSGEKGTGYGLHICKGMIEKMNGSIEVESEGLGKGITVTVTLPASDNKFNQI